ncbi:MAG: hypothetical protein RM338_18090 [Nostoc sp. DedQUE12a]|nr:hypothetical protein [Nostoc sp. DedQUE12a]
MIYITNYTEDGDRYSQGNAEIYLDLNTVARSDRTLKIVLVMRSL